MTIRRADGALWRRSPTSVSVLAGGRVHVLGGPAVAIWDVLEAPRSEDDVVAELVGHFEGDPDRISTEAAAAIDQLVALAVLERSHEPG